MASANVGHEHQLAFSLATESSAVEAMGGAAVVVLGILGLARVSPLYLAPIATIVVGVALWFEGAALVARYSRLVSTESRSGAALEELPAGSGMSAEFLGGAAGTVLGILALLGVASATLTSTAVIVYGAALLFGNAAQARMGSFTAAEAEPSPTSHVIREAASAAWGAELLVGVAATVLGILALVGLAPEILVLSALLTVGAALALSGAAFATTRVVRQRLQH